MSLSHTHLARIGAAVAAVTALNGVLTALPASGASDDEGVPSPYFSETPPTGDGTWAGNLVEVPPLVSDDLQPLVPEFAVGTEATVAGAETADAQQRADVLNEPVTRTEVVSERAADRRVFDLPDGTREVEFYAGARLFQDKASEWQLIDTAVVPDEETAGGLRSAANSWTARFLPLDSGTGGVRIESGRASVELSPVAAASVTPVADENRPSAAAYHDVWPGADLVYTVKTTGVEEDIVLASPQAGSRFEFAVSGARAEPEGDGLVLVSPGGEFVVPTPTVVDASGRDVTAASGVALEVADDGATVAVVVDETWLAEQPRSVFPLHVDPSVYVTIDALAGGAQAHNYGSTGGTYTNGDLVRIGRSSSGVVWRSRVHFNYEPYLQQQTGEKYRVLSATMGLIRDTSDWSTPTNGQATPHVATSASYAGAAGRPVDNGLGGPPVQYDTQLVMRWGEMPFESWLSFLVDDWFDEDTADVWFGFTGNESTNGTMHTYWPTLQLQLMAPPPTTTLAQPAAGTLFSTRTPTLTVAPVSGTADPVFYRYEVSTQRGTGAASMVSSGWTTATSWTVPDYALLDGATYYARVYTAYDVTNPDLPSERRYTDPLPPDPVADREFTIDLKLGAGGPAPMQAAGTVPGVTGTPAEGAPTPSTPGASISVNMVDGNLAASVPTHSVTGVGGSIAPQLVYNSLGTTSTGLVGEYFADPNHVRQFGGTGVTLRAQRVDPQVDFDWLAGPPPVESIPSGSFLARWTGHIAVPATGTWKIGVVLTDWSIGGQGGARVYLNDEATPAVDRWSNSTGTEWEIASLSANRQMTAGAKVPIRVELRGVVSSVALRLVAMHDDTLYIAQPSWLTQTNPVLPDGWQLSTGAGSATWVGLTDLGDSVVVRAADGSGHGFERTSAGGYRPPVGSSNHLTINGQGRFALQTSGGLLYTFRPDGSIEQVTTVADDRHPAAYVYTYSGSVPRLSAITDPVSDRSVFFDYGPTDCAAPNGRLCRIRFWDGAVTELGYDASGRLIRVTNPGYATGGQIQPTLFDFGYGWTGRLTRVRDPLAADLVAYGTRPNDDTLVTKFEYDIDGKILWVTKPAPTQGGERPTAYYAYWPQDKRTGMQLTGFTPASDYARQVEYDERGRIVSETDPTGTLTTTYRWNDEDRLVATVDPAGLQTSYGYDSAGRPTDTWGPAPESDFGSDDRPLAGATVPHAATEYDGDLSDLATAYWPNPYLAGVPSLHGTGLPEATLDHTWATAPVTPDPDGRWTMRMTGEIAFPQAGSYTVSGAAAVGDVRLWIDDTLVYQRWDGVSVSAQQVVTAAPDETHRIRIEYRSPSPGTNARLRVSWQGPGIPDDGVPIPDSALRPSLGLATRTTDPDGVTVATEYADAADHIGPEYGLATATITDPSGLALTTRSAYEDPTAGGYLRQTGRTLPAGNTWTSTYYGGTEGPIAPVCGVDAGTPQGGFLRERTGPDPTGPDTARVEQFVYDAAGRVVGERTGTTATIAQAGWSCTYYDGRGRVQRQTWPAHGSSSAFIVVYSYAAGGDPLTTTAVKPAISDVTRQITTTTDLAGRLVSYWAGGFTTTTTYDRLGRIQSSTGPVGALDYAYEPSSGRLRTITLDGVEVARIIYETGTGRTLQVRYRNSGTYSDFTYDRHGRQDSLTVSGNGDTPVLADEVAFSDGGRVVDEQFDVGWLDLYDPSLDAPGMVYDTAGRLTTWIGPSTTETYSYGPSACGSAPSAGKNTNLALVSRGTTNDVYCYDEADRLVVGGAVSSVGYDDHGNTTELNGQTYQYDAADRLVAIAKEDASSTYLRDPVHRIVERATNGVATYQRYAGLTDEVSFTVNDNNQIVDRRIALPGNATLIVTGTTKTWAYSNLRGDVGAVTDNAGWRTSGPTWLTPWGYGTPVAALGSTPSTRLGFLGGDGKDTDVTPGLDPTVELGARTYHPALGRFLSVDPIIGGCANDYVYVNGDPLGQRDPTGEFCWKSWLGVALGILGVAAAIAAPFTGGSSLGIVMGIASVAMGGTAMALDASACRAGNKFACGGFTLGVFSVGFGVAGLFAPAMGLATIGEQVGFAAVGATFSLTGTALGAVSASRAERQGGSGC